MAPTFALTPRGPFDLANQQRYFGGWLAFDPDPTALAMAFPVEGWTGSAAVVLRQAAPDAVTGDVHGVAGDVAERAWHQALAVLSLDVDGTGFPAVGARDPAVGRVGDEHAWIRPILFHSPYEAACNFVIGQRISMVQARAMRRRMADESGDRLVAGGTTLCAFPRPQQLLDLTEVRGLPPEKLVRLHGIARAALDGLLNRERIRALPAEAAVAELQELRGVGPFSAQGIVFRGAGVVDAVTDDPVSKEAVRRLFSLDHVPDHGEVVSRAEPWRPFRMWSLVLLHVWLRSSGAVSGRHRHSKGHGAPGA
jgi:DNA-3-methyladenine glycosylase II